MKISLQWIKEFADVTLPDEEIIQKIAAQIGEVEGIEKLGERYQNIVVAQIKEAEDHPDADKLGVYTVDIGNKTVQVVAGDKSLKKGDSVAYIPPGTVVPETFGTDDEFVIEKRQLRSQESNGMLASAKELGFSDNHENVLVLDESAKVGSLFVDMYDLDDTILEIENKALTHRPDCFGVIGFAREVAGIQNLPFKTPKWFREGTAQSADILPLSATIQAADLCPRFVAQAYEGVSIKPSPVRAQTMLNRIGIRPINNVVDLTNYMMVLTGQPFHAFDYNAVAERSAGDGANIIVRRPVSGEKITLLDGREIEPHEDAAMVATAKELLSVGGSIGGADTEVHEGTTKVILEAANWDLYGIRTTSMKHGIFTEAVTRFARGQDPNMCEPVMIHAGKLLSEWSGAKVASSLVDDYPEKREVVGVTADSVRVNDLLGAQLSPADMAQYLSNVELDVTENRGVLDILVPTWRADIHIEEDIVEEVGRLHGYNNLAVTLPFRTLLPVDLTPADRLLHQIRDILQAAGANEQLSYNFISEKMAKESGYNTKSMYQLKNALSPELQYLRPGLLPSVMDHIYPNHRQGYGQLALYEINKAHSKKHTQKDGLPHERQRLALVFSADDKTAKAEYGGAGFYQAKAYLDFLMRSLGLKYQLVHDKKPKHFEDVSHLFHEDRQGCIVVSGEAIGIIGEFTDGIHRAFKLPIFAAGFEIDLEAFCKVANVASSYRPIPKYPSTTQDVTFQVPVDTAFGAILDAIEEQLDALDMHVRVQPHDIYQDEKDKDHKHFTYRLTLQHYEQTMLTSEVNSIIDQVVRVVEKEFLAQRI